MQQLLERFAKLGTNKKYGILAGLCLVLVVGYFLGPYKGKAAELTALKQERESLLQTKTEKKNIVDNLEALKEEVRGLEIALEEQKQELPDNREIDGLLEQVDNLARRVGLRWESFSPMVDEPQGFYARVPVQFSVSGDYHSIAVFFAKVGNLKRIVNIEDIQMGAAKEENGKLILKVSGVAVTYRFIEGGSEKKKG